MRHKWIVLQILLLSSVCLAAEGQDRCTVSGTVLDRTDSLALHGALVSLTSAYDSTVVFNTVTDGNGAFGAEVDAGDTGVTGTGHAAFQRQWDEGGTLTDSYENAFSAFFVQHRHLLTLPQGWYIDIQGTYYSPLTAGVYRMQHQ